MKFNGILKTERITTITIIVCAIILQIPVIFILNKMFGNKYYLYNAFMIFELILFLDLSLLKNFRTIKEKFLRMLLNFLILLIVYLPVLVAIDSKTPNILQFVKFGLLNSLFFFIFIGFVIAGLQVLINVLTWKEEKH